MKISLQEQVALVGESGCGKSTVVSLLLRFYDCNKGSILIDGTDITKIDLAHLRKAIGLIMQEPVLFNSSIKDNILYGNSKATSSELLEAAQAANVMEFIDKQIPEDEDSSQESSEDDTLDLPGGF